MLEERAERWLAMQADLGRARNTILAYRRALHDYAIHDTLECGLVLTGTEVKSLRAGRASLADGFAQISDGEVRDLLAKARLPAAAPSPQSAVGQ